MWSQLVQREGSATDQTSGPNNTRFRIEESTEQYIATGRSLGK
jgi:hypothetical protein